MIHSIKTGITANDPLKIFNKIVNLHGGQTSTDIGTNSLFTFQNVVESFHEIFERSADVINMVGGTILLVSCFIAILNTASLMIEKLTNKKMKLLFAGTHEPSSECSVDTIRLSLGSNIIFALEILIAADVIDTLTKPVHSYTLEGLYKIAVVVLIRTTLSYFLGKELEEIENKLEKNHHHHSTPVLKH